MFLLRLTLILLFSILSTLSVSAQQEGVYETTPTYHSQTENDDKSYRTWFWEWSYTMIPASITHGAEMHFEVPPKVKKNTAVKPAFGFGGGYQQHLYKQHDYDGYKADVFLRRYSGHATIGLRTVNRSYGVCARGGYNAMYMQYEWSNITGVVTPDTKIEANRLLHRIHTEIVAFKSFSKKKPGVGILAGVQYLVHPTEKNQNVFIIKGGLAF